MNSLREAAKLVVLYRGNEKKKKKANKKPKNMYLATLMQW